MARRTQTYAIRLAVEGGGQVKAELVSVGQSGEQTIVQASRITPELAAILKKLDISKPKPILAVG